jgi:membrane protease YdiL (CAAX protease family)
MRPGQLYRLAWGFYLVLAVGGVVWLGWGGPIPLTLFVDPAGWWLDLGLGLAGGLALLSSWQLARLRLAEARRLEEHIAEILGPLSESEAVALALLSGFAEELFFRGAMQQAWGWLAATVLFALLHSGPGRAFRIWTGFAAVAGLLFAVMMLWRGNLLAPVVAHVLVNAVNLRRLAAIEPPPPAGE